MVTGVQVLVMCSEESKNRKVRLGCSGHHGARNKNKALGPVCPPPCLLAPALPCAAGLVHRHGGRASSRETHPFGPRHLSPGRGTRPEQHLSAAPKAACVGVCRDSSGLEHGHRELDT